MEARVTKRHEIRMPVLMYQHNVPVMRGWVRDISLGGVFVEAEPLICCEAERLDLEFSPPNSARKRLRLTARVTRNEVSGVGLSFAPLDRTQRDRLWYWLRRLASVTAPIAPTLVRRNHG